MEILRSHIKTGSHDFQRNRAHHEALAAALRRRLDGVANGASPQALDAPVLREPAPVYRM